MLVSAGYSSSLAHFFCTLRQVLADLGRFMFLFSRPRVALAAENLFLRKQLALFQERKVRPRRAAAWAWILPGPPWRQGHAVVASLRESRVFTV